ncbi:cobalamin synthase [Desulfocucumis palustris]|uniref:Adenosylcobinamide-GDP ribazoletransferase n=1 Tax=Desulfocucumis palustris TaxID=1898651 RepID=A0A2L2X9E1_9FIRM|nr:adenosylcobinamide-GDP ribazoletransferase [Desulfocucumis palustris]GBF32748.1 cobalamin synthase [Desulfocucumis palustris]
MNKFLLALQMLTRIHVREVPYDEKAAGQSVMFFPLVGLLLGGLSAGVYFLSALVFPPPATAAIAVLALVIATGGLHLDGFMDTMDGVLSGRPRERKLEIMKDSRVGAFGALGAVCLLLLKFSLVLSLPGELVPRLLIIAPVISRWSMACAVTGFPYARPEGLGKSHANFSGKTELWVASLTALIFSGAAGGPGGIVLFALGGLLTQLLCRRLVGQLGGLTGDTYGATNEIVEVAVLFMFFPVYKLGLNFLWPIF